MIKIRILAMVLAISSIFGAIAMGAEKHPSKAHKHAKKTDVTYIDMATPSGPESEYPVIVDKGKL